MAFQKYFFLQNDKFSSNHTFVILRRRKKRVTAVHFNEYLRSCREYNHFTQEQLVQNLYQYDIDSFAGLDTTTLSKWERSLIRPKLSRQVSILKYFQSISDMALPCLKQYTVEAAEEMICRVGMRNLLGKSKKLILNFPDKMIGADDIKVIQLRNSTIIDKLIGIHIDLDNGLNRKFAELLPEHFRKWALHPSNSFYICEYKEQFFGLLFTLRLKHETFEKIINLEIKKKDLTIDDFASYDEVGSNYILSFFAMSEKAATMLLIRYYAHLIANQKVIAEVGVITMMDDARKLLSHMHFKNHRSKKLDNGLIMQTHRASLSHFLASEYTVKMILSKQECPEE